MFLLMRNIPYEDSCPMGIFSELEKAQAAAQTYERDRVDAESELGWRPSVYLDRFPNVWISEGSRYSYTIYLETIDEPRKHY